MPWSSTSQISSQTRLIDYNIIIIVTYKLCEERDDFVRALMSGPLIYYFKNVIRLNRPDIVQVTWFDVNLCDVM